MPATACHTSAPTQHALHAHRACILGKNRFTFFNSPSKYATEKATSVRAASDNFFCSRSNKHQARLGWCCRSQLLEFYASSGDFTRRLTSVKANGKFSSPSAGAQDYWTVSPYYPAAAALSLLLCTLNG